MKILLAVDGSESSLDAADFLPVRKKLDAAGISYQARVLVGHW